MRFFTGGIKMSRHVIRNSKLRKYMLGYTNKSASGADDFFAKERGSRYLCAKYHACRGARQPYLIICNK